MTDCALEMIGTGYRSVLMSSPGETGERTPHRLRLVARSRGAQVAIALIAGALAGLIVFVVTRITGRNLFLITGAVGGLAAAAAVQFYRRTAQLTEVKITVPQFSELTFVVNNDARQVAWRLFVETVTRTATQPLGDDEGIIREAMNSLYSLFAITRDTLKDSRPSVVVSGGQTVEQLAVTMLNWELRPFLSKWHPRLTAFERANTDKPEDEWADGPACRADLRVVQEHIRVYALGFAKLAGVRDAATMVARVTDEQAGD
jgi:hypothetical protein